jgi:competence protein ComEC
MPRWKEWGLSAGRWWSSWVVVSSAAWVGSAPLVAHYFHVFSPITVAANVAVVPMGCLALGCSLGSLICGDVLWPLTEYFNNCGWLLMGWMVRVSEVCAELPGGHFFVRGVSGTWCVMYFGVVAWFFTGGGKWLARRLKGWQTGGAAGLVVCGMGVWVFFGIGGWGRGEELCVLPVDGGVVAFSDGGGGVLVDCGRSNGVERVVAPLLRSRGVNRLGSLVLTHGDVRHVGGAVLAAEVSRAREVCVSGVRFRSGIYRWAVQELDGRGVVRRVAAGERVGKWTVLHPGAGEKFSAGDDGALVLHGILGGVRVLLVSDLGPVGQAALLASGADLRSDIVVTGLPTKGEALGEEFLERVGAKLVVVGDSADVWQERARDDLLARLEKSGAMVVSTARMGGISILFPSGGVWRIESARQKPEVGTLKRK